MLNKIWFALLLIGVLYGLGRALVVAPSEVVRPDKPEPLVCPVCDKTVCLHCTATAPATPPPARPQFTRSDAVEDMGKHLTTAGIDAAKTSVEICLGLIGVMALWLGFMRVAEDAGLIKILARILRPVLRWLFPEVPKDHPAGGAIIMNMAANILGLDNAATPLGLKAMKELQTLNDTKDTATNSMAMFLAINTSAITLIPFTIIGYRAAADSKDPAGVVVAMILATACSTIVAISACRILQRFYPMPPKPTAQAEAINDTGLTDDSGQPAEGEIEEDA